jgi:hypothetical protein
MQLNWCFQTKRTERPRKSIKKISFYFIYLSLLMCVFSSSVINKGQQDNNVDEKNEVATSVWRRTQVCP